MAIKLILTALLSLGVGAAGVYATVHVTATCIPAGDPAADAYTKQFFSQPFQPTGGKEYK